MAFANFSKQSLDPDTPSPLPAHHNPPHLAMFHRSSGHSLQQVARIGFATNGRQSGLTGAKGTGSSQLTNSKDRPYCPRTECLSRWGDVPTQASIHFFLAFNRLSSLAMCVGFKSVQCGEAKGSSLSGSAMSRENVSVWRSLAEEP